MAKVVKHQDLISYFGESDHLEVSRSRTFSSLIYEMLTEKVPNEAQLKVFELILNLSIDHGTDTPSAKKVIEEAQKGENISEAVSEGIEEINDTHGGAAEPLMEMLYKISNTTNDKYQISNEIEKLIKSGNRLAGYGHRIYKQSLPSEDGKEADPRAQLILEKLVELGFDDEFIKIAKDLRQELFNQSGKYLTMNIDGAIAVAFCTLELDPKLGKAIFIIARTPGLCAHYLNNSKLNN